MATLTVTVPDAQVPRVQAAMGAYLQTLDGSLNPRDATAEEVRQYLVDHLIAVVVKQEQKTAEADARLTVTPIGAT
ncbi:hypothetical protein [[Eubacterium] cellulosolvens]